MYTITDSRLKEIVIERDGERHFYTVPSEIALEMKRSAQELEETRAELTKANSLLNAEEFELASKIIVNLSANRMGNKKVLNADSFGILDDFWAELEARIVHAIRNEDVNGNPLRPDMIPRITGADADEFIRSRRRNFLNNKKGIITESNLSGEKSRVMID